MKTIKIRDLRGSTLEAHARNGDLVGLTRDRALIAVVIPAGQAWVEHLVDRNWSQVTKEIAAGEAAIAGPGSLPLADEVVSEASEAGEIAGRDEYRPAAGRRRGADELAEVVGLPTAEMLRRLGAQIGPASPDGRQSTKSSTIRVGDLSARRIDAAGQAGELLVLTNDGMQVGIVVPVSQKFVEFLVTQNLSRIMYDARRSELDLAAEESSHL
ncbi:hypothetical protein [Kribbella jiaozuonensis]|uniref:Uncharacterized protein n=1 Tax=Kribbella jiaozuonensis TaxID=2575441 RepID=A0A4U3M2W9_9ACTN|nr:hypothetical protein [Kribbella jiaozuonensis]TKK81616.1 hypothetical protein FDA38_01875 [Kribbella jiaozuonensis]